MTERDYAVVAMVIRQNVQSVDSVEALEVLGDLAMTLTYQFRQSPSFNASGFLKASGFRVVEDDDGLHIRGANAGRLR